MTFDTDKDRIKAAIDFVDLVREYVPDLKQRGREWQGLCPFHEDTKPSFSVNPDKQVFFCHGCGKGGDVFEFLQAKEGWDFAAALQYLADKTGGSLDSGTGSKKRGEYRPVQQRSRTEAANVTAKLAKTFRTDRPLPPIGEYQDVFDDFYSGCQTTERVIDYIAQARGLNYGPGRDPGELAQAYGICQVIDWPGITARLQDKYSPDRLAASGLAYQKAGAGNVVFFDWPGRVIFPFIRGGRRIDFFQTRSFNSDKDKVKWRRLAGRNMPFLYNIDDLPPRDSDSDILRHSAAIVTESPIDALSILCLDPPLIDPNYLRTALGCIGTTSWHPQFAFDLGHVGLVIVIGDNDDEGPKFERRVAETFDYLGRTIWTVRRDSGFDSYKDINQMLVKTRGGGVGSLPLRRIALERGNG